MNALNFSQLIRTSVYVVGLLSLSQTMAHSSSWTGTDTGSHWTGTDTGSHWTGTDTGSHWTGTDTGSH